MLNGYYAFKGLGSGALYAGLFYSKFVRYIKKPRRCIEQGDSMGDTDVMDKSLFIFFPFFYLMLN